MNDFQARAPAWRKLFGYEFADESSEILNLDSTVRNDFILPLSTCATNFESTLFFAIKCQFSVSILPEVHYYSKAKKRTWQILSHKFKGELLTSSLF